MTMTAADRNAIEDAVRVLIYRLPPGAVLQAERGDDERRATVTLTVEGDTTTYVAERNGGR